MSDTQVVQVHAVVKVDELQLANVVDSEEFDLSDLAIWIDPIDATSQYIKGGEGAQLEGGRLPTKGLKVEPCNK